MASVPRSAPLHRRLLLIAAAGIVPVALASGFALYGIYSAQRQQAERTALEITRALSTALDAELQRTVAALEILGNAGDPAEPESFRGPSEATLASRRQWNNVLLNAPTGEQLLNARVPRGQPLPGVVEPGSVASVVASAKPSVGFLARGPRGSWAVPVRVPVVREGRVAAVLSAILSPDSLLDVVTRQRLQEGWVVTAVDSQGTRVLRWPRPAEYIGTPVSGSLRQMMSSGAAEGTGLTVTSEGTEVYTAYSRSPQTGWIVALGIPRAAVEAAGWSSLRTFGGGVALSLIVGFLAALLVGRRILAALAREHAGRVEAEGMSRAKDEFLAMLGHELRNPLSAASNAAHLLQTPGLPEPARRRASDIILRQVHHLGRLTDDLLDVGRALTGKITLQRQDVNLAEVARHSLATLRGMGRFEAHAVHEDLGEAWAHVDPIRLDQVITNLVVNAVKYTPRQGRIEVRTVREGAYSVLRVRDDGIGMTPDLAARAFDLFVQGDRQLDRAQGGLGIGLTLVRRLAELHGGTVEVASEGEDRGTEFVVRFPAIEHAVAAPAAAPVAQAGPREVLVIEDNEDAREMLQAVLEAHGHRVTVAADGAAGLELALRGRFDVALVDIGLPGIDGYEVARRLRAAGDARPYVVALTGYGQPEDRERALDAGFDDHLVKPVDPARIEALIAARERAARP